MSFLHRCIADRIDELFSIAITKSGADDEAARKIFRASIFGMLEAETNHTYNSFILDYAKMYGFHEHLDYAIHHSVTRSFPAVKTKYGVIRKSAQH